MIISRDNYPFDVIGGVVGSFFVASMIPSMHPLYAAIFSGMNTSVQYPLGGKVHEFLEGHTKELCSVARTIRAWTSIVTPKKIDTWIDTWTDKQIKNIAKIALTYIASVMLTCMCMNIVGIPFMFTDAVVLSTSGFIFALGGVVFKTGTIALQKLSLW